MRLIDLTGNKYGRLTVVRYFKDSKWECLCDCGNTSFVISSNLKRGTSNSCGCINKEHGFGECGKNLRYHELYQTWKTMIYRCTKEKRKEYINYGGRGILVCDRWMIFSNFIEDMYGTYKSGFQLDRKNNDGNYEKDNCHWVKPVINKRNTRRCKLNKEIVELIRKSEKPPKELSILYNCSIDTIYDVLNFKSWN